MLGLRESFIKRYIVEMTNKPESDQKNRLRKRRVVGRIYEKNTGKTAIKTETDTRTEKNEWASSFDLCLRHKKKF